MSKQHTTICNLITNAFSFEPRVNKMRNTVNKMRNTVNKMRSNHNFVKKKFTS